MGLHQIRFVRTRPKLSRNGARRTSSVDINEPPPRSGIRPCHHIRERNEKLKKRGGGHIINDRAYCRIANVLVRGAQTFKATARPTHRTATSSSRQRLQDTTKPCSPEPTPSNTSAYGIFYAPDGATHEGGRHDPKPKGQQSRSFSARQSREEVQPWTRAPRPTQGSQPPPNAAQRQNRHHPPVASPEPSSTGERRKATDRGTP